MTTTRRLAPRLVVLLLFITVLQLLFPTVCCFSLSPKSVPGIWKVELLDDDATSRDAPVLLRLLDNGSFQQCNDGTESSLSQESRNNNNDWSGIWDYTEESAELCLALDRHCITLASRFVRLSSSSLQTDLVLSGKVLVAQENHGLPLGNSIAKGVVMAGKAMYPRTHPSFFEQTLLTPGVVGHFDAHQVFSFAALTALDETTIATTTKRVPQFDPSDLVGQKFVLTVTPLMESSSASKRQQQVDDDVPVDIRAMRMEFHANSTFTIRATNKILRGKFEITTADDHVHDQLSFHVSRFGAGKSAPGSVYSEGPGLSHEDERTYVGLMERVPKQIMGNTTTGSDMCLLNVEGTVTFGTDLGSDARPEPVGNFRLWPVDDFSLEMNDDDDDDDDDEQAKNGLDSVFE